MTLAEALIGSAALAGATTMVSNNIAQKNNIAQQDKAMDNARAIVSGANNNMANWFKSHPQPGPGVVPTGTMGNGPATGTSQGAPGPSPSAVANNVIARLGAGGAPAPSTTPAIPATRMPGGPMTPNLQAILSRLQQQGLAVS